MDCATFGPHSPDGKPHAQTIRDLEQHLEHRPLYTPWRFLGRYTAIGRLAATGCSWIYRAQDEHRKGQYVAVKVMRPSTESAISRIMAANETAIMRHVGYPFTPTLIQAGRVENSANGEELPFLVCEYVRGRSFPSCIRHQDRSEKRGVSAAIRHIVLAAESLQALRKVIPGYVHRDLKPQNLIVRGGHKREMAVLLDHALACWDGSPEMPVGGTPVHMPPEAAMARVVGRAAPRDPSQDLFALGTILFELVTDRITCGLGACSQQQHVFLAHARGDVFVRSMRGLAAASFPPAKP